MTETITNTFETKFGKFAATDKATYKKLKRINHLLTQVALPWVHRWERAQRRLPHNRVFRIKGQRLTCKDSWLFNPFYEVPPKTVVTSGVSFRNPNQTAAVPTSLLKQFREDYSIARHPQDKAEDVKPLTLTEGQIGGLLSQLEEFAHEAR